MLMHVAFLPAMHVIGQLGLVDGEVAFALYLQIAPIALIPHQRLIPACILGAIWGQYWSI